MWKSQQISLKFDEHVFCIKTTPSAFCLNGFFYSQAKPAKRTEERKSRKGAQIFRNRAKSSQQQVRNWPIVWGHTAS
jgi:hypothetical protein